MYYVYVCMYNVFVCHWNLQITKMPKKTHLTNLNRIPTYPGPPYIVFYRYRYCYKRLTQKISVSQTSSVSDHDVWSKMFQMRFFLRRFTWLLGFFHCWITISDTLFIFFLGIHTVQVDNLHNCKNGTLTHVYSLDTFTIGINTECFNIIWNAVYVLRGRDSITRLRYFQVIDRVC